MGTCDIAQLKYTGIDAWRKAGFTGKGITIWNAEPINSDHGANSTQMLKDIAPGAKVITGSFTKSTSGNKLISCTVTDEQDKNKSLPFEEFVAKYRPSIISSSNKGSQNEAFTEFIKDIQKKYNFSIFNCAYNDGDNEIHESITCKFPIEHSIIIGALTWNNGVPTRPSYSSVGKALDFAQLVMWWSGTSAATPVQVGMASMIMERYGHMSQNEMYKYLQMTSKDLQTEGRDIYTGWGQPILPDTKKKYITMTTNDNNYYVDGVEAKMDTTPVNKAGTVFVPVRVISESLGKQVDAIFNDDNSIKVIITDKTNRIELNTGSDVMFINGKKILLNFPPYIDSKNRCLVPIRAITEAFGYKVVWIQQEAKIMILE